MDLQFDDNFDLVIDETNDLGIVEGNEAFRQALVHTLTLFLREVIGESNAPDTSRKVEREARRALQRQESINSIENVSVEPIGTGNLQLYAIYNRDEIIEEELI